MSCLDRLKKIRKRGGAPPQNHQNPESRGSVGLKVRPRPLSKIEGARAANDPGQTRPRPCCRSPARPCRHSPKRTAKRAESAQKSAAPSRKTCRHLEAPGLSAGCCGERGDLPPAYTAGHPASTPTGRWRGEPTTWGLRHEAADTSPGAPALPGLPTAATCGRRA